MITAIDIIEEFRTLLERVPDDPITTEEIKSLIKHVLTKPSKKDLRNLYTLKTKVKDSAYTGKVYRGLLRPLSSIEGIISNKKFSTDDRRDKSTFESWSTSEEVARGFAKNMHEKGYGIIISRQTSSKNQIIFLGDKFLNNLRADLESELSRGPKITIKRKDRIIQANNLNRINDLVSMIKEVKRIVSFAGEEEIVFTADKSRKYELCNNVERILLSESLVTYLKNNKNILKSLIVLISNQEEFLKTLDSSNKMLATYLTCNSSGKLKFHSK